MVFEWMIRINRKGMRFYSETRELSNIKLSTDDFFIESTLKKVCTSLIHLVIWVFIPIMRLFIIIGIWKWNWPHRCPMLLSSLSPVSSLRWEEPQNQVPHAVGRSGNERRAFVAQIAPWMTYRWSLSVHLVSSRLISSSITFVVFASLKKKCCLN